ncbi:cell envelope integrity protein CreD [Leptospira semungkisensis]|uniref:Cell envelope integrity protein CreD n=1 Tax=Leptospira semungkisensis TaxID=2484985 RepID=A0A4R9FNK9_9LEPT|nr:cell envelope integrity protein CreD [Leptospira semungkisensis]TGJ99326.1 cell envelope integrity protein CreD [Leptospira semungkisensis]
MSKLKTSVSIRVLILGTMLIGFVIPLSMMSGLVSERQERSREAVQEINSKWGGSQRIAGPFLVVPYKLEKIKNDKEQGEEEVDSESGEIYILPETLTVNSDLKAEKRKRSIFETVLFTGDFKMEGSFKSPTLTDFPARTKKILWSQSRVILSVLDPKGIGKDVKFNLAGKEMILQPGSSSNFFPAGLHTKFVTKEGSDHFSFSIEIPLKGSDWIYVVPTGKTSTIKMSSDWKDPSFVGSILPNERSVTENGFQAVWESSYFARNYPQVIQYMNDSYVDSIISSAYGVSLIIPADQYLKSERSLKYAILFLAASFTLFFLLEIFGGKILHPLQYLMIGVAMLVFYILNLSLSEHIGFNWAYVCASISVSALISYYAGSVLQDKKRGYLAGGYFTILYTFLYVILASEENALLLGSLAIFFVLAGFMHLTRNVDWYSFGAKEDQIPS